MDGQDIPHDRYLRQKGGDSGDDLRGERAARETLLTYNLNNEFPLSGPVVEVNIDNLLPGA